MDTHAYGDVYFDINGTVQGAMPLEMSFELQMVFVYLCQHACERNDIASGQCELITKFDSFCHGEDMAFNSEVLVGTERSSSCES